MALLQSVVNGAEVSGLALELWITDDNAQLALMHLYTWQVTGSEFFRTVVEETPDHVVRETLAPRAIGSRPAISKQCQWRLRPQTLSTQHLPSRASSTATAEFKSRQDADVEGEEGKFRVWTPDQIRDVLGDEAGALMASCGVTLHGNTSTGSGHGFEGKKNLEFVGPLDTHPTLAEAVAADCSKPGRNACSLIATKRCRPRATA